MKNHIARISKNRSHFSVSLPLQIIKDGNAFVASCPVLDIATQGSTFEEAEKMFDELVKIFVEELDHMGTTAEYLLSMGWTKSKKTWVPPERQLLHESNRQVNIPCPA